MLSARIFHRHFHHLFRKQMHIIMVAISVSVTMSREKKNIRHPFEVDYFPPCSCAYHNTMHTKMTQCSRKIRCHQAIIHCLKRKCHFRCILKTCLTKLEYIYITIYLFRLRCGCLNCCLRFATIIKSTL